LSTQSSPGKTEEKRNQQKSSRKYWFEPRSLEDIPELKRLFSNDTSLGVGFSPFSTLELLIINIEKTLNSNEFHKKNPWIGSDIKIMGFRYINDYKITMCVPQIGSAVKSIKEYKDNIKKVRKIITKILGKYKIFQYNLDINTRDNYENGELYLTAIGSSIESGDEGLVGRGNRVQGFIAPMRPMSMEGAAGKNPVYHIGKIYYVMAQRISEKIYKKFKIQNEVALVSQSGRDLLDPWIVFVGVPKTYKKISELEYFVKSEIKKIPELTKELINLKISIC
jgi:S-adenosylmethionine synthetase